MPRLRARRRPADAPLPRAGRSAPWVLAGLLLGAALTVLLQAPAHWLAQALASASQQRLLLTETRGSLWSGSGVLVLGGGEGSRQASALPGRLQWQLGLGLDQGLHLALQLTQACCIDDTLRLRLEPGIGRLRVALPAGPAAVGRWPASWLVGLGAPFNTLRLGGALRLTSNALSVESVQGRWRVGGSAELELLGLSSPLTSLDTLGSYRLQVLGDGPSAAGNDGGSEGARLNLATLQGPLRLAGQGQWVGPRLRFRGDARADPGSEAMLNNLLNLMGQRQGALALLVIG